jgi:hypothetical protein
VYEWQMDLVASDFKEEAKVGEVKTKQKHESKSKVSR